MLIAISSIKATSVSSSKLTTSEKTIIIKDNTKPSSNEGSSTSNVGSSADHAYGNIVNFDMRFSEEFRSESPSLNQGVPNSGSANSGVIGLH